MFNKKIKIFSKKQQQSNIFIFVHCENNIKFKYPWNYKFKKMFNHSRENKGKLVLEYLESNNFFKYNPILN